MEAAIPETPHPAETPYYRRELPSEAFIPTWVQNLQSPRHQEVIAAVDALTGFVCRRLIVFAALIDQTALPGQTLLADRHAERPVATPLPLAVGRKNEPPSLSFAVLSSTIEVALFSDHQPISSVRAFYERSAAVVREYILSRLQAATVCCTNPRTKARLNAWMAFHNAAGKLRADLRAVHDLMFYGNCRTAVVATFLGESVQMVEGERRIAKRLMRPLYDKARGKT